MEGEVAGIALILVDHRDVWLLDELFVDEVIVQLVFKLIGKGGEVGTRGVEGSV